MRREKRKLFLIFLILFAVTFRFTPLPLFSFDRFSRLPKAPLRAFFSLFLSLGVFLQTRHAMSRTVEARLIAKVSRASSHVIPNANAPRWRLVVC
jgi:hypothetical protein